LRHFSDLSRDGTGDNDGDGVEDIEEYYRGMNPGSPDTDGDGSPDFLEIAFRGDPLDPEGKPSTMFLNFQPSASFRPAGYVDAGPETFTDKGFGWRL